MAAMVTGSASSFESRAPASLFWVHRRKPVASYDPFSYDVSLDGQWFRVRTKVAETSAGTALGRSRLRVGEEEVGPAPTWFPPPRRRIPSKKSPRHCPGLFRGDRGLHDVWTTWEYEGRFSARSGTATPGVRSQESMGRLSAIARARSTCRITAGGSVPTSS